MLPDSDSTPVNTVDVTGQEEQSSTVITQSDIFFKAHDVCSSVFS